MKKFITEELKDRIIEMSESGMTIGEIAEQVGFSQASVQNVRKERGYRSPTKGGWISRTIPAKDITPDPKKEEKPSMVLLNEKIVELVGVNTMYTYTASIKGDKLTVVTGDKQAIEIHYKDLVYFVEELGDMVEIIEKMRANKYEV